jgi:DNA-binding transcriptional LysR family regulator
MVESGIGQLAQSVVGTTQLQTFCVVARTNNFTRAAKELGCSQSTVTVRIRALEHTLGKSLFERNRVSKTVILTDAGKRALPYAQQLLALFEEAKSAVSGFQRS